MGRVYLCLGQNAEAPYYFERARVHIWNVEELCYFLRENVWLLEPALFSKQLCEWLGDQCGLKELSRQLEGTKDAGDFLQILFAYTGYYDEEETKRLEKALQVGIKAGDNDRRKARGDYYLESGRYIQAIREYRELLDKNSGMGPEYRGNIIHNLGVAQAGMFWFERAAESFEQAFRMTGRPESARQFLTAKRFALPEQEYLSFLATKPALYEVSLQVEKQVEQAEKDWQASEDMAMCVRAKEAKQDGAVHICEEMVEKKARQLQDEYRSKMDR